MMCRLAQCMTIMDKLMLLPHVADGGLGRVHHDDLEVLVGGVLGVYDKLM